ncbi:MAG: transporter substrate-binding domain-containing protein [Deltaproteobacteria bacterium]|nr:transporter substrate-binding domain-containing protein [Deltaproteobacteria bacterium]
MKKVSATTFFLLVMISIPSFAFDDVITVASDCWEPYICCSEPGRNKVAVDIFMTVFKRKGYTLNFKKMSWKTAILDTEMGKYNAILCATKGDAPGFIYPEEHVAVQRTCFYTEKSSTWKYKNIESLSDIILGITADYHYSNEIDKYIKANINTPKIQAVHGETPLNQNVFKLKHQRISAMVEDPVIMQYFIYRNNETGLRQAGCVSGKVKLYIPFSPNNPNSEKYATMFTEGIKELKESGKIQDIYNSYGLEWNE